jgi:hypothetical protein
MEHNNHELDSENLNEEGNFLDDSDENFENIILEEEDDSTDEEIIVDDLIDDDVVSDETVTEDSKFSNKDNADDVVFSKHSIHKKHSLNYDSIFKGKKESPLTEDDSEGLGSFNETFEVDKSSIYWYESVDNENYIKEKRIKERVYEVLAEKTDLNFMNNRRKPSRSDFNHYYFLLKTNLKDDNFTNVELFNELAVYFSDNLFNMFKLLDNKWRNMIISELQEHIGKQSYSKEVRNRNIHIGTEIEFLHIDPLELISGPIHITGVVVQADYETSSYIVDSYEKLYEVAIDSVTQILNNTKFKYNLNKLNNIDFL